MIIERRKRMESDSTAVATGGRLAFLDLLLEMERNGDMTADDIQQEVGYGLEVFTYSFCLGGHVHVRRP